MTAARKPRKPFVPVTLPGDPVLTLEQAFAADPLNKATRRRRGRIAYTVYAARPVAVIPLIEWNYETNKPVFKGVRAYVVRTHSMQSRIDRHQRWLDKRKPSAPVEPQEHAHES